MLAQTVEHIHQAHHAIGTVSGFDHVLHSKGIGLALVVTAVTCQQRTGPDLPQLGGQAAVTGPRRPRNGRKPADNCLGEHAL